MNAAVSGGGDGSTRGNKHSDFTVVKQSIGNI